MGQLAGTGMDQPGTTGLGAKCTAGTTSLVQSGDFQPKLSRAGIDRDHSDHNWRAPHRPGRRTRMGAWHDGGIARDAGWYRGAADRQTGAVFSARAGLHGARRHHSRAFVWCAVSGFPRRPHFVLIALHAVLARSGPFDLYRDPQPTGRRANLSFNRLPARFLFFELRIRN